MATLKPFDSMPTPIRFLLAADVTMIALFLLDNLAGHPNWKLSEWVNLERESNLPTWYSSCQLLILGLLLTLFAHSQRRLGTTRVSFFAGAVLCVAMSLDEVAQVHEWVGVVSDTFLSGGTREGSLLHSTGIWMFILGVPFLMVSALLWRGFTTALQERGSVRRLYLGGFILYVASALGVELLVNFVTPGWSTMVQVVAEEFGEMVGVTLLVWATVELLASYDIHLRIGENRLTSIPP